MIVNPLQIALHTRNTHDAVLIRAWYAGGIGPHSLFKGLCCTLTYKDCKVSVCVCVCVMSFVVDSIIIEPSLCVVTPSVSSSLK